MSKNQRDFILAHAALLGANLFYGAGFSVAKSIMPSLIQPNGFILIRVVGATILFWLSFAIGPEFRAPIERKDWKILFGGAVFGVAINQLLFFQGLQYTTPIHASLMMLSTPILVSFFAVWVLKEKITFYQIVGLVLGVCGAALLIMQRVQHQVATDSFRGDILVLLNATSYSIYFVMVKPLLAKYRAIIVIRWVFLLGCFLVLPFGWHDVASANWTAFGVAEFAAMAFIVIGVTFFTYLWNMYSLRVLSPATAGSYIYIQPVFAALISIIYLGEELNAVKILAALLIFLGVYGVGRKKLPRS